MIEDRRGELARRPAVVTALVALVVLGVLAAVLVPWQWVPGGRLVPMPVHDLFTTREIARAEHYAALRRVLGRSAYFGALLLAVVLGLTPLGARAARPLTRRVPWWVAVPLLALGLLLAGRLLTLPLGLLMRRQDLRAGLTHQGLGGWAADQLTSLAVSWVVTSLLLLVAVGLARRSPRWWFAWAGGAALVLTLAGSFLYPLLVEPLFNHFTPLPAGPFRQSVFRLADREGVHIRDVLVADASRRTTTVNAYVSGFGSTRRVVVYDNLLHDMSPAQARVVIAHELGHAKHNDVLLGTTLGAVGTVAGVAVLALLLDSAWLRRRAGVAGPGDPAVVAAVLALVALGGFLVSPLDNGVSRAIEARADVTALETTHESTVFVRMQRQLALRSLADPTPPALSQFWFGTHPTTVQRAGLPASLEAARR